MKRTFFAVLMMVWAFKHAVRYIFFPPNPKRGGDLTLLGLGGKKDTAVIVNEKKQIDK